MSRLLKWLGMDKGNKEFAMLELQCCKIEIRQGQTDRLKRPLTTITVRPTYSLNAARRWQVVADSPDTFGTVVVRVYQLKGKRRKKRENTPCLNGGT